MIPPRTEARSIWASPAAAVPPGDVTMRRRSEQLTPVSSSTLAVPTMVERMSARAVAADSPLVMPASSKASITRPRKAGPEPARAVAASNSRSSSVTTVPIWPSQPSTRASASSP